jgi:hypothetical protein
MTTRFRPLDSVNLLDATDTLDGFDFAGGDFPNAVLVSNTDTGNAVVVSVYADTAGTYAAYPAAGNDYTGYGVVVQPATAVLIAVNTTFAAAGPGTQLAGTAQCAAGKTATVLFNAGALEKGN